MKILITIIILLIGVVIGYVSKGAIDTVLEKASIEIPQAVKINQVAELFEMEIQEIAGDALTSGPFIKRIYNPSSVLTVEGAISETNKHRTAAGLAPLKVNPLLAEAAQKKVQDMFDKQYLDHTSPDGVEVKDLVQSVGYSYIRIGENLAQGNFKDDMSLLEGWMESPGHRANILKPEFTEIGVAVMKGFYDDSVTWMAVQEFGKPRSQCPEIDSVLKSFIEKEGKALEDLRQEIETNQAVLKASKPGIGATVAEVEEYNKQVEELNASVREYNTRNYILKQKVVDYNAQISDFNSCIGK